MASVETRRAAGTKSFMDLMTHRDWNRRVARGLPATDPAADLVHLAAGDRILVRAVRKDGSGFQRGVLALNDRPYPLTWYPGRLGRPSAAGVALHEPIQVDDVRFLEGAEAWKLRLDMFRVVQLHAAGQPLALAVPHIDLELVLTALGYVEEEIGG